MSLNQKDSLSFSSIIKPGIDGDLVIFGFPYEIGSKRVNLPSGHENGPDCFRRFFNRIGPLINPETKIDLSSLEIRDYGNIMISNEKSNEKPEELKEKLEEKPLKKSEIPISLEKLLGKLQQKCLNVNRRKGVSFVIGGGRDACYGPVSALLSKETRIGHINIMASLDCKELFDYDKITAKNVIKKISRDFKEKIKKKQYKVLYFAVNEALISKEDGIFLKENENIELFGMKSLRRAFIDPETRKIEEKPSKKHEVFPFKKTEELADKKTEELTDKTTDFPSENLDFLLKTFDFPLLTKAGLIFLKKLQEFLFFVDEIHLSLSLESINVPNFLIPFINLPYSHYFLYFFCK